MSSTGIQLNDLLRKQRIDPSAVFVLRHRPHEPELNKVLPWFALERPEVYNAYQQTQGPVLERAMAKLEGRGYVVSFIGHAPGEALFVGLYRIAGSKPLSRRAYWQVPAHKLMRRHGMVGWRDSRRTIRWFDLCRVAGWNLWTGRLIIDWPRPERAWWRRAHRNELNVKSILEESRLLPEMPAWKQIDFTWEQLKQLPNSWRSVLAQWRGIYLIFDSSTRRGYVGAAYGRENLLGRWLNYAHTGHGGNVRLRRSDPGDLRFTILERVSPDLDTADVIRLEASWKRRLHTRYPSGLNDN
jgi:hypothetical protein